MKGGKGRDKGRGEGVRNRNEEEEEERQEQKKRSGMAGRKGGRELVEVKIRSSAGSFLSVSLFFF